MTETPGSSFGSENPEQAQRYQPEANPSGAGYPPPPASAPQAPPSGYPQSGGGQYPPPPAQGYEQPGYSQPGFPPPAAPPPGAQQQGWDQQGGAYPPPAGYAQSGQQGGFAAGASDVGQQFQNFDPKTLQNFDPKTVNPLDWGIIGAGVLALIFSFFGFYHASASYAGFKQSASWNAWHGFFGWFGVLVALVVSLVLAAELVAKIRFPFGTRLVVLGGFALALLCELLALLIVPIDTGGAGAFGVKVDKGHGFGYWIVLLLVIVGTGLAYRRFTDSGGKLPRRG